MTPTAQMRLQVLGKKNVASQVDNINHNKLLAIISGHLESFTHADLASHNKIYFFLKCEESKVKVVRAHKNSPL